MIVNNKRKYLFEDSPIYKAVLTLAIPTIISQLITLIYNWADTYFVGQLNDPYQMAAVTVCHPAFMMSTALANLFGIGGASAISRALGEKNNDKVKKIFTFSIVLAFVISIIYSLLIFIFQEPLLILLGASDNSLIYCEEYLFYVVILGTLPSVLNYTLAHLIRATGKSKEASFGIALGGILNIILDPILIFTFKLNIVGAAIATCISNLVATLFFVIYLCITRKDNILDFNLNNLKIKEKVSGDIFGSGISSFCLTLMAIFSNISINNLMSQYSDFAVSGVSIAKKIDLFVIAFSQGLTQGTLPLIGYNHASKNIKRRNNVIKFTAISALIMSFIFVIIAFSLSPNIVSLFIKHEETVNYGSIALRIMCVSMPLTSMIFLINTVFQATKETKKALLVTLLRKGIVDIPIMIGLNILIPLYGIIMSQPIVDVLSSILAFTLFIKFFKTDKNISIENNSLENQESTLHNESEKEVYENE